MNSELILTVLAVVLVGFICFLALKKSIHWVERSLADVFKVVQRWAERTTDLSISLFRQQERTGSQVEERLEGEDLVSVALGMLSFGVLLCAFIAEFMLLAAILGPLFGLEYSFGGAHFDWIVAGALLASIVCFGDTLVSVKSGTKNTTDTRHARKLREIPASLDIRVGLALLSGGGIASVGYVVCLAAKMRGEALLESPAAAMANADSMQIIIMLAVICFLAILIDVITSVSLRIVVRLIVGSVSLVVAGVLWSLAALTYGGQLIAALITELVGAGPDGQSIFKLAFDKVKDLYDRFVDALKSIFGDEEMKEATHPASPAAARLPPPYKLVPRNVKPAHSGAESGEIVLAHARVTDSDPEDRRLVGVAARNESRMDQSRNGYWEYPG